MTRILADMRRNCAFCGGNGAHLQPHLRIVSLYAITTLVVITLYAMAAHEQVTGARRMMDWSNKAYHLFGAFFFVTVLRRYVTRQAAIWLTAIGCVLLEVYEWIWEPHYDGKELDTVIDLIADAVGIWMGAR